MQDNLEFLQWMKRFYDLHNPGHILEVNLVIYLFKAVFMMESRGAERVA